MEAKMSNLRRIFTNYVLLLPTTVLLSIFLIIPIYYVVLLSFYTNSLSGYLPKFTFENYVNLIGSPTVIKIITTTLTLCGMATLLSFLVGYPVAYTLAYKVRSPRKQTFVLLALVIPFLLDYSVRTFSWYPTLSTTGLINLVLMTLGLIRTPANLLFSEGSLTLIWLQTYIILMVTPLYLALTKIDPSLPNAARMLGASLWQTFWKVTFPLSLPGVVVGSIYVFIASLSDYATPAFFGGGIQTIGLEIAQRTAAFLWPAAAALGVITLLLTLALAYVVLRFVDLQQLF
ncbi:MAG: hypothetical protein C4314_07530 [Thermoflexus sp.]